MRGKGIAVLLAFVSASCLASPSGIVFVLDASNSMNQRLDAAGTKFEWAKEALTLVLEELPQEVPFAVVAFGHRVSKDLAAESCLDLEILVPYGVHVERTAILRRVQALEAMGKTPLARALSFAAGVAGEPARLVLLTDGEETCGGDPLAAARDICADGSTLDVVAVGVTSEVAALLGNLARTCGGRFVLAEAPAELPALFREVAMPQPEVPEAYRCYPVDNVIWGGEGDDVLIGTPANDLIFGLGGKDLLIGLGGDDVLVGGGGNDVLQGGEGDDRLEGGPGDDRLLGGPGDDTLLGEAGSDVLEGEGGDDVLSGGEGDDKLLGGPGCDRLEGGPGTNFVYDEEGVCEPCPAVTPPCEAPPSVKEVDEGSSIVLRADVYDPDGDQVSVTWWAEDGFFSDPNSLNPTYYAPWVRECEGRDVTIRVTAVDSCGAKSEDTLVVHVRNVNHPPTADAGPDMTVPEGGTIQLCCSASDPDGDALTYTWKVECGRGSFDDPHILRPKFTAPLTGRCEGEDLVLTLIVRDACGAEARDTMVVHVQNVNQPPWVDAGPDLSVSEGGQIAILAKAGDPDGEPLRVEWWAEAGSLSGADSLCPVFHAPEVTGCDEVLVNVCVTVTDPCGAMATDSLVIRVRNVNHPPTVKADP